MEYNKGEHRKKHLGRLLEAECVWQDGLLVGKCPSGFSIEKALELLKDGIPERRKTWPHDPFRIWTYYDGTVYASRSEDHGVTWHGYPIPGSEMPFSIEVALLEKAKSIGEEKQFKNWCKKKWNK